MSDEIAGPAKGPASYFPSIEKTYGPSMEEWFALVRAQEGRKRAERVAFLKAEHSIGHGHANAIVAHVLAADRKA